MNDLIATDTDKAMEFVSKLARFFNDTRDAANVNAIPLDSELKQVNRYIDFRNLSFSKDIDYIEEVPDKLKSLFVPSRCLMTIIENSFKHGFQGRPAPYKLSVRVNEDGGNIILLIMDNGNGIQPERLAEICKRSVNSDCGGGGIALFNLSNSLDITFSGKAKLAINSQANCGTETIIILPKRNEPW